MGKKLDLVGQRFGRLVVLEEAGRDKFRSVLWRCKCDCGSEIIVRGGSLRRGYTTSCGCYNRACVIERNTKHGMSRTRLHRIWLGILTRAGFYKCANERLKRGYIDRGIDVCEEWLIFENFRDWALSHGYSDDLELDRKDNDKGYSPDNCWWVTRKENSNNRRNTLRFSDGTSLAILCAGIGIETRGGNGHPSKQYDRIRCAYRRHKIHPELIRCLRQDIHDQARALYAVAMKRQYLQDRVKNLKKVIELLKR